MILRENQFKTNWPYILQLPLLWNEEKIRPEKPVCSSTVVWFLPFCEDVAVGRDGSFVAAIQWIEETNELYMVHSEDMVMVKILQRTIQCCRGRNCDIVGSLYVLLLHEDGSEYDVVGHGATMLSLRSQMNPIPEVPSNTAFEGKLGKRQPDSRWNQNDWLMLDTAKPSKISCSVWKNMIYKVHRYTFISLKSIS